MNKKITIELTDKEYAFYQGLADYTMKDAQIKAYVEQTLKMGIIECARHNPILYRSIKKKAMQRLDNEKFIKLMKREE